MPNRTKEIQRVLIVTLLLNITVSTAKIIYGYYANSVAIVSDGYHSMLDGISNIIGLVAITLSGKPADKCHPYGHRKVETLFTIFIGLLMLAVCVEIFYSAYEALVKNKIPNIDTVSLVVMLVTLCVNVFVVAYERRMAKKLHSEFLHADAKHTLTDIYVTIGVLIGLVAYLNGIRQADAIAGIIVGLIVAYTGVKIIKDSADILVDINKLDPEAVKEIACSVKGVIQCHEIRARGAEHNIFIDMHVLVSPEMTVLQAHMIAHEVEKAVKSAMPEVVDVVVHIEPAEKKA